MRPFKVYLAGPIAGLSYGGGQEWRSEARWTLQHAGIAAYSPLRGKAEALPAGTIAGTSPNEHPLATDAAIMGRDHYDCTGADCILAHLADAAAPSLGTAMELAWAFDRHIPVVATWREGGPHDHPMIRRAVTHRAADLQQAIEMVKAILLP